MNPKAFTIAVPLSLLLWALLFLLVGCVEEEERFASVEREAYTPAHIEIYHQQVQECLGLAAPMPDFFLVETGSLDGYDAWAFFDGTILVERRMANSPIVRHELVHWVLAYNGHPDHENTNHVGPAWECGPGYF